VVMMGEMSLDDWDEKSGKKNDEDDGASSSTSNCTVMYLGTWRLPPTFL